MTQRRYLTPPTCAHCGTALTNLSLMSGIRYCSMVCWTKALHNARGKWS